MKMLLPIFQEIPYQNSLFIFALFAEQKGVIFLDSARLMPNCGRYSFIALDPFLILRSKNGEIFLQDEKFFGNPWIFLQEQLAKFPLQFHPHLPPFQGGAVGFFSYELYQHLENITSMQHDDQSFPDMLLGFYNLVIAFDHEKKRAWIFSSGEYAQARCDKLAEKILSAKPLLFLHRPLCAEENIHADFSRDDYINAVTKVKNYILAGDIFEANISQRFKVMLPPQSSFQLYQRLREINPAPFSAYLSFGDEVLVSASPERFLKLSQHQVESRPIKGTRPRGKNPEQDRAFAFELMNSEKDHAENVMIVDLLRNDLSRVCEDHSVQVPTLCGLESYETVHHLVSVVTGKLKSALGPVDLLQATFPGGSITGAPKIRAMEIIAEIEPTPRGPYCGSIGYIGFNGDMDLSITIRTFAIKENCATFQAGGAVVLDSDPVAEYEETLTKISALRRALVE